LSTIQQLETFLSSSWWSSPTLPHGKAIVFKLHSEAELPTSYQLVLQRQASLSLSAKCLATPSVKYLTSTAASERYLPCVFPFFECCSSPASSLQIHLAIECKLGRPSCTRRSSVWRTFRPRPNKSLRTVPRHLPPNFFAFMKKAQSQAGIDRISCFYFIVSSLLLWAPCSLFSRQG
jgi:hypothetical protein